MSDFHEQRINIKFCFKLGKTFTETHAMLKQAYGDQCMSRTSCHEWFKRFKHGRQSANDELRSGRPTTSSDRAHVAQVREMLLSNRRLTVRELAEKCNISVGSCHTILTDIRLKMIHEFKYLGSVFPADGRIDRLCILKMIKTDSRDRISSSDLLETLRAQPQWKELLETLSK